MELESCFKIGYIVRTHGLKGEVTIALDDDSPDIASTTTLFIEVDGRLVPYFVQSASLRGSKGFIKFEDINSIEDAGTITKRALYLPKSARPDAGQGEFYDDEVVHFEVVDEGFGALGNIVEIMQAGPNRLLVVDHDGKEVLIPVNSPFITSINKKKRIVNTSLPEGFLEI